MSADSRMPRRYGAAAATRLLGAATTSLRSSMLGRSSAIKATSPATSQRSATTTLRGTRSGPSFCLFAYLWSTFFPCVGLKELTQISAARFPPATQCSHRVHTKKPGLQGGLGPGFRSQKCRHSEKMPHRPIRFANEPSFGEFPNVWPLRRESRTAVTLLSVSGGPFHA